jgi:hypothetical protein
LSENDTTVYATIAYEQEMEQDCYGEIKIVDVVVLSGNQSPATTAAKIPRSDT